MNFKLDKCKKSAILAAVFGGMLLAQPVMAAEADETLVTFDKDTTMTAQEFAEKIDTGKKTIVVDAGKNILTVVREDKSEGNAIDFLDKNGEKLEITAKKLVLRNDAGDAKVRTEGLHVFNEKGVDPLTVHIHGDVDVISVNGGAKAQGLYAGGESTVIVDGNVTMRNGDDFAVAGLGFGYYGAGAIYSTGSWGPTGKGATVVVKGDVDMKIDSQGLFTNIRGSVIDVYGGGRIEVRKDSPAGYAAIRSEDGRIFMNVKKDSEGKVIGAGNRNVEILGNIAVTTGAVNAVDKDGTMSSVDLGLSTPDSSLTGIFYNAFPAEGKPASDLVFFGETNLYLENGATWTNERYGKPGSSWGGLDFAGSRVTNLHGGADAEHAGNIIQKEDDPIEITNYSGHTNLVYNHDAENPDQLKGGETKILNAAEKSGISLQTGMEGLNIRSEKPEDRKKVLDTLVALKGKLDDSAVAPGHLDVEVKTAPGLITPSARLAEDTAGAPVVEVDASEPAAVTGVKEAAASSAAMWRAVNTDLHQRMGDVRLAKEDQGIWAKYKGGKISMDEKEADFSTKYHGVTVGYDKVVSHDWVVGGAVSHLTGDGTYSEGDGDLKQTEFAVYGTKLGSNGTYLDLVAKAGQLKNDFRLGLEEGRLNGDYKATTLSASAEYGKRFVQDNGFYLDPSVQLTVGRIGSKGYDAHVGEKTLHVDQDSFTSTVGRLGVSAGFQSDTTTAFVKLALAHEFSGSLKTGYAVAGEGAVRSELDLKDTWGEVEVGATGKVGDTTYLYGTFARSLSGDVENKWRVDAGVRFIF